ncbi:MAG: hypothetical protein WCI48_06455 [Bacteroidota bacterium]|jgi:hypothetical protein
MALTVNFFDVYGKKHVATINVSDFTQLRPIDVIQIIRDKGYTAKPTGGTGTTIWKMGKPNGGGNYIDELSLDSNGIQNNDIVLLREWDVINSPCVVV